MIHPVRKFSRVREFASVRYQCLTIRVVDLNATVIPISLAVRKVDEELVYNYIDAMHKSKSVVVGDFKARHKSRDTADNERVKRLA